MVALILASTIPLCKIFYQKLTITTKNFNFNSSFIIKFFRNKVKETAMILLQTVPKDIELAKLKEELKAVRNWHQTRITLIFLSNAFFTWIKFWEIFQKFWDFFKYELHTIFFPEKIFYSKNRFSLENDEKTLIYTSLYKFLIYLSATL